MRASSVIVISCISVFGCSGTTTTHLSTPSGDDLAHSAAPVADLAPATVSVDIGDGVSVHGSFAGGDFTLDGAPAAFTAPLTVTVITRLGYQIHSASDLNNACAVALAPNEPQPTFSGTMLFDPLSATWLGATILSSPAGQKAGVSSVYVTNAPAITSAQTSEASLAASVQFALTAPPHDAEFTSNNWALLCDAAKSTTPATLATITLGGTFNQAPYKATITLAGLTLQLS